MTTDHLRDELARIASDAPVADVSLDTWARARRARVRDRAVGTLGAVAVVVAVLGLAAGALPRLDRAPVAAGDGLGVPDRLYAVPERMSDRAGEDGWSRDEVETDLAVGTGAAAWVTGGGLPVVVDADDGDYHLLDLPGFAGNDALVTTYTGELGLTLSPDGRQLAYAWGDPGPEDANRPVPSGVRVVDLESGEVREIPVVGGEGTLVGRLRFSPDGRWIVWTGRQLASWTEGSIGGSNPVAGRIAPDATASTPVSGFRPGLSADAGAAIGVGDDGVVVALTSSPMSESTLVQRWDGRLLGRTRVVDDGGAPVQVIPEGDLQVSPDGLLVQVGSCCVATPYVVDLATGVLAVGREEDDESAALGAYPVGWVDDATSVWLVGRADATERSLVLVDLDGGIRRVGTVEGTVPDIATDLMSPERPTVTRTAPAWPWSTTRHVLVWGSLAALLLTGLVAVVARRRAWTLPRPALRRPPLGLTGPEGLVLGAIGAAAVMVGWFYLVDSWSIDGSWPSVWAKALEASVPAATMTAGAVLLFFRGWRWWGAGLIAGPPVVVVVVFFIVVNSGVLG